MLESHLSSRVAFSARTAREIQSTGNADGSVLVVPVGAMEQHGSHLPVATDALLVGEVSLRGTEAATSVPALVLPPVWSGHSQQHLPFGGTVTTSFETLRRLLTEIAATAPENRFDAVLFVNGHIGNRTVVDAAVGAAGRASPDTETLGVTYFDLAAPFVDEIRESAPGGMAHGGEFETSLMLHLFPDLVRDEREGTPLDEPYALAGSDLFDAGPLSVYRTLDAYTESGVMGDPSLGTAEKGERFLEGLTAAFADLLVEIHEANR